MQPRLSSIEVQRYQVKFPKVVSNHDLLELIVSSRDSFPETLVCIRVFYH